VYSLPGSLNVFTTPRVTGVFAIALKPFFRALKAEVQPCVLWLCVLYPTTVDHHSNEFLNKDNLKPGNGGSDGKLSAQRTSHLIIHLSNNLLHHVHEVIAFVAQAGELFLLLP